MTAADAERLAAIRDIIRRASGHVDGRGLRLDSDELCRVLGEAFDCGAATVAAERDALAKDRAYETEQKIKLANAVVEVAAERDAEKERADKAEAGRALLQETAERIVDERNALQALIEAAIAQVGSAQHMDDKYGTHTDRRAMLDVLTRKSAALAGDQPDATWEYGVKDYRQGVIVIGPTPMPEDRWKIYGEPPLVRRRPASEWEDVVDRPEATPEQDDVPGGCIYCCSSGIVEDYEGDRPCSACDGTGTPRLREVTPEPPHLDPEPWVCPCGCGNRYLLKDHLLTMVFDPHPADENGKPYSDNIEHYKKEI